MMLKSTPLILAATLAAAFNAHADVKPAHHFQSNMVIQRDADANIWGSADPGEAVTVSGSWGKESKTTADAEGKWMVQLATPAAGGPFTITFNGNNEVVLDNVLSGDVWICSGQSNMDWNIRSSSNYAEEIANADYPNIRYLAIPRRIGLLPEKDSQGSWLVVAPDVAKNISAVGYYFGRELHTQTDVPIGLIRSSWGGTRIEPWIPPQGFDSVPALSKTAQAVREALPTTPEGNRLFKAYVEDLKAWIPQAEAALDNMEITPAQPKSPTLAYKNSSPTVLYNGMIYPLVPLSIKGAIWYQGESNGGEGESYFHKMQALIGGWREVFGQGDFPFYFVQLANFRTSDPNNAEGGDGWSKLRQAQLDALSIPNTGMAVAIDVGDARDIHPKNKQDVGKRLAYWALAKNYGKDIVYSGPQFKSMTVDGNKAVIAFDHVGGGLMSAEKSGTAAPTPTPNTPLSWFSIRDAEGKWHKANARIEGDTVVLTADSVTQPTGVRYAYTMNPAGCNLYNKEGLPASPFTFEVAASE